MWSCNRRFFVLSAVALAGCGLTPVYGPNGAGTQLLRRVRVDTPDSVDSYQFTRTLEDRLGRADSPAYGLAYDLTLREEGLAVLASQAITRYNVLGEATFALTDLDTSQVVASGRVSGFTGYSATGTTVATRAAQTDAQARLVGLLADQVVDRLALALSGRA